MENETLINYEAYKKYYLFSIYKRKHYKIGTKLFYGISAFSIFICIINGIAFGFDFIDQILLALFILIDIIMSLLTFYLPKKIYKSAEKIYEGTNCYKFYDDYFKVEKDTDEAKGISEIKYSALFKIYEVEDYFYIFISRSQAYMVDKRGFKTGSREALREILQDNLAKKYYKYC